MGPLSEAKNEILGSWCICFSSGIIVFVEYMRILYICFGNDNSQGLLRNACESYVFLLVFFVSVMADGLN